MKHLPHRWLLAALLGQAALCACGSSTAVQNGASGAAPALRCAPASAKPESNSGSQTAALCAPPPERHS